MTGRDTELAAVRLRDGRRLTYRAIGDSAGFPVVYLHGAIGSPRWRSPALDAAVDSLGIRYVAVNRPGFSGSDPCPDRTVADHAADVEELADALGWQRFSVIGVSAGAPFALACAWRLPGRVVAAAAASPLTPAPSLRYRVPAAGSACRWPARWPTTRPCACCTPARPPRPATWCSTTRSAAGPWGFEPADVAVPGRALARSARPPRAGGARAAPRRGDARPARRTSSRAPATSSSRSGWPRSSGRCAGDAPCRRRRRDVLRRAQRRDPDLSQREGALRGREHRLRASRDRPRTRVRSTSAVVMPCPRYDWRRPTATGSRSASERSRTRCARCGPTTSSCTTRSGARTA